MLMTYLQCFWPKLPWCAAVGPNLLSTQKKRSGWKFAQYTTKATRHSHWGLFTLRHFTLDLFTARFDHHHQRESPSLWISKSNLPILQNCSCSIHLKFSEIHIKLHINICTPSNLYICKYTYKYILIRSWLFMHVYWHEGAKQTTPLKQNHPLRLGFPLSSWVLPPKK